ncbi:MAG: hypothetical protein V7647_3342 [Acidobacteriota bacterium]|jgi:hypothetical protein
MYRRAHLVLLICTLCGGLMTHNGSLSAAPGAGREAQASATPDVLHRPLDQILDVNVRDGLVYYRALKSERGRLDRYAASLNVPAATYEAWPRDEKMAFWVNAYNAFVLQTVVDRYPIHGSSPAYPADSIRQIPGAFQSLRHRAAGRSVTLDEIEKTVLPEFREPRLQLALGRGAVGSGRLRSEAYSGARIAQQLDDIQKEFVSERTMLKIDRTTGEVSLTPILSWHQAEFIAAYDTGAQGPLAQRSPIERAAVAFITPNLLPLEKELLQKNEFKVTYHAFDWRLNDLTGGRTQ